MRVFASRFEEVDGALIADEVIAAGGDFEALRKRITAAQQGAYTREEAERERGRSSRGAPSIISEVGDRGTVGRFSFARAIIAAAMAAGHHDPEWARVDIGRERELGNVGTTAHGVGISIPTELRRQLPWGGRAQEIRMERAERVLQAGTGGGANLVGVEHMDDLFIEALTAQGAILSRVTTLPGLVQDLSIPRMSGRGRRLMGPR